MRRIRSVALSCALVLAGLLATAPVASAAPAAFGMAWTVWGTVYGPHGTVQLCPTTDPWDPAQTLELQVLSNGAWVTKQTYAAGQLQSWDCVWPDVAGLVGRTGTFSLRAVTSATATWQAGAAQTTITLAKQPGVADVVSTAYTTTTASKGVRATVTAEGQHLILQRKVGASWVTVSSVNAPTSGTTVSLRLAVSNLAGLSWYRVVMGSTAWDTAYYSDPFPIHQTDMAKYGSYIALARSYMASFCPVTPIYVNTPGVTNRGTPDGLATFSASSGGGTNTLSTRIELRSGLTGTSLRHISLHECAHVMQYRSYVENRYDTEVANANRLWPGTGVEGQADCMAYYYVRSARDLYYVRSCSATQLTDALRMWRAYGSKYQAATYTWKS